MPALSYHNFDLSIEAINGRTNHYSARVLDSPVGQARTEFELSFSALEVENYRLGIGRLRQELRAIGPLELSAVEIFGRTLFAAVFREQVQAALWRSIDIAKQRGEGVRIRLRLDHASDLMSLPWEYLYDTAFDHFLCLGTATPLVRYLELPQTALPLAVQPPLQILVMIANPQDCTRLDVDSEWRKVQIALTSLEQQGLVRLTCVPDGKLGSLQGHLRRGEFHVFHYIGHGMFDEQTQDGMLLFEDDTGLSQPVSGNNLGVLLHNHPTLRLVLLNACEGARPGINNPFAGVAQRLVRHGIPAVIAMQFAITDSAAITLSQEFYAALADGYPVDAALTEARTALFTQGNAIEWGTPVLYLRAENGRLFDLPAALQSQSYLDRLKGMQDGMAASGDYDLLSSSKQALPEKLSGVTINDAPTKTAIKVPPIQKRSKRSKLESLLPLPFAWVEIPAGLVEIADATQHHPPGTKGGQFEVAAFAIAQYPITNAQFQCFVDALDGYQNEQWWLYSSYALQWRRNNPTPKPHAFPGDTLPRTNVNWYEAVAFCQWLSKRTRQNLTLPTEQQWQRAAQGDDHRKYPWGNNFDKSRCNFSTRLPTPITHYPTGASPFGVMDMCGNVLEWCRTKWGIDDHGVDGNHQRILRGGSWHRSNVTEIYVTARSANFPDFRLDNRGFRIVKLL